MKLLTIIGARPQIIKAAALSRAIRHWNETHPFDQAVHEVILHTGQHYDENMSTVFFQELGIPEPDINLHVGSGSHGTQTAKMMEGIEKVLCADPYDGVVLYGDTNSTIAGAVAAAKLNIPVFHIEAGLRSWNRTMPEEINRIVCDQLSNILFTPTQTGYDNLLREGFVADADLSKARFANGKGQYVCLSGDVMYDNSIYFADIAEKKSDILQRLGLRHKQFVLATIHRPANTDHADNLTAIFRALLSIAQTGMTVVLPLHPRTKKMLPDKLPTDLMQAIEQQPDFIITAPASFFEIICLEKHARIVMTDSGGVQKESFFFHTPCVILRPETEWVEIIQAGEGIIADADYQKIFHAYQHLSSDDSLPIEQTSSSKTLPYGDAHAAEHILKHIVAYLQ